MPAGLAGLSAVKSSCFKCPNGWTWRFAHVLRASKLQLLVIVHDVAILANENAVGDHIVVAFCACKTGIYICRVCR